MDSTSALLRIGRITPRLMPQTKSLIIGCRYSSTAKPKESSAPKKVGPLSSGGSAKWKDLSGTQKVMRTSENLYSLLTIVGGAIVVGGVSYFMYQEVFSPNSKTVWFNRVVERVKSDERCTDLIGPAETIKAFGEVSPSKWAKSRPLASDLITDSYGVEHLIMHFNVEGDYNRGVVRLHLEKRPKDDEFHYKYLLLEVPGKTTIYLEKDERRKSGDGKGFLGIQWTWNR